MKQWLRVVTGHCHLWLLLILLCAHAARAVEPMQGVPPARDSQVTMGNYNVHPMSRWAFRNAGAPLNTVVIPRAGDIRTLVGPFRPEIGEMAVATQGGVPDTFDGVFEANLADGVVIVQGTRLMHERYFHDFRPNSHHIWFSMTKSLVSSAFGLLVEAGAVDLAASPVKYLPELADSGFNRTTIQDVLDHRSAIDFKENYTDPESEFARFYAPALNMLWLPGARDVNPADAEIFGVHDFLGKFVKADTTLQPGDAFDYNSTNADVLGWLIARISGSPLQDYLQENIWAKLGTEHDAFIVVDRAYMPVATGGMNSTLRDAARFGMMIRDFGKFSGEQVVPAAWIEKITDLSPSLRNSMAENFKYGDEPWEAYHNMWWVLDAEKGEFCAVGVYGQVIYINRYANTVMAWFSSQPVASAARNAQFRAKLSAAREIARKLRR